MSSLLEVLRWVVVVLQCIVSYYHIAAGRVVRVNTCYGSVRQVYVRYWCMVGSGQAWDCDTQVEFLLYFSIR